MSRRYTGPSPETVALIAERSHGYCEFPGCGALAQDPHHRYERGQGGRGPKGPDWINAASNILASCRHHNDWASNVAPTEAKQMGWRLSNLELPWVVPVQTCHDSLPVYLDNAGGWWRFGERGAA